jgi:magnesium-transporting ATPase (P-type)
MVLAGMFVVQGQAQAIVTATGGQTRLAGIAHRTQAGQRPRSPLAEELDRVVRVIFVAALAAGILFLTVAATVGIRLTDAFLFSLGVVVALVPEGLLPTVTLSLAWGAQRMAQHHALVRRLEAVETLGSTTFICTDKTGTLTLNEMSVVVVWTPSASCTIEGRGYDPDAAIRALPDQLPALRELARSALNCSSGRAVRRDGRWIAQGNALEVSLDVFARRIGVQEPAPLASTNVRALFPFDPRRRRMSAVIDGTLHVKGAPEAVISRCTNAEGAGSILSQMTRRGLRVLAVARRSIGDLPSGISADEVETDLELLGLFGIEDPPRPEVAKSIAACRRAGLAVGMITGDHPETARAIAKEVGLLGAEDWVLEGCQLPEDEARLGALVDRDGIVVSRVSPEDKLRIARALQARGHVVAMTGDGVNDGPALQEASIGIAMGRGGTDVAREAADLVLLDDNFATIVAAIKQGRTTFENTRRFLTYHLTDNVAELAPFVVWAISGGRFPLALSVLQVLALDLGTDILSALALGAEPPADGVLEKIPGGRHLLDLDVLLRSFGVLGPVEALIEMAAFLVTMVAAGWSPGMPFPGGNIFLAASGAAFSAVVLGQMANAFACRSSRRWPGSLGWTTNRFLIYAVTAELLLLLIALYVPPIAAVLGQAPPSLAGGPIALIAIPSVLLADALHKYFRRTGAF